MKRKLLMVPLVMCFALLTIPGCSKDAEKEQESTHDTVMETTTKKDSKEEETTDLSGITFSNDSTDANIQKTLKSLLGENRDSNKIVCDLNFNSSCVDGYYLTYKVLNSDLITKKGVLKEHPDTPSEVVIKVNTHSEGDWYFKLTLLDKENSATEKTEILCSNLIHNTDNIRGNIYLPETVGSNNEISISWSCDRPDLITLKAGGENNEIPAGVVTRGDTDQKAVLTATITSENYKTTKDFHLTIKAKPAPKTYSAYLYTYFRGNIYGNGESQHIHMATSKDGFFWTALNDNEPILKANLGTKGVRDSYLVRSPYGDHFYLIGTDLDANGGDWASYGGNGSRYIRIWESDDLINWSDERLVLIAPENAACMWAPETTYDPSTGEYVVYWSTGLKGGDGKKIWYAKTRDFYTFSTPQIYKDTENGTTFIDTSIIEYQGTYYRFTKNENNLTILLETSDSLLGDYSLVKTNIAGESGVEGPGIYKINGEEKWVLYMDGYAGGNSGVGYFPLIANSLEDLKNANFVRMENGTYQMPAGAKHGSFVPITTEEYNALINTYGSN